MGVSRKELRKALTSTGARWILSDRRPRLRRFRPVAWTPYCLRPGRPGRPSMPYSSSGATTKNSVNKVRPPTVGACQSAFCHTVCRATNCVLSDLVARTPIVQVPLPIAAASDEETQGPGDSLLALLFALARALLGLRRGAILGPSMTGFPRLQGRAKCECRAGRRSSGRGFASASAVNKDLAGRADSFVPPVGLLAGARRPPARRRRRRRCSSSYSSLRLRSAHHRTSSNRPCGRQMPPRGRRPNS